MKISGPSLLSLALATLLIFPAHAGEVDKDKLAEIDRGFVCPESIPDSAARQEAIRQFILQVRDAWPSASVDDTIAFRVALLNKHKCTKTLEAIQQQGR